MKYTWSTFDKLSAALLIFKALCESLKKVIWRSCSDSGDGDRKASHQSQSPKARVITMDCVSVASLSCYSIFLPLMGLAGLVGQLHCDCSISFYIQSLDVLSNEPDASCPVGLDLSLEKFDRPFHSARKSYVTRLAVNAFSGIWLCNEHMGLFETWWEHPQTFSQAHLHATGFSKQLPHQWNDNSKRGSRRGSSTGAATAWGFFPAPETSAAGTRWTQFLHDCMILYDIILH